MNNIETLIAYLYRDIMNIPAKLDTEFSSSAERLLYKEGHRDARHAAVELVLEFAMKLEGEPE